MSQDMTDKDPSPAPAANPMRRMADFFDPKAQAQRQAAAEKRMREAEAAEAALAAGTTVDKNGTFHIPHEDIHNDAFRGDTVTWGHNGAELDALEKARLETKARMPWTEKYRPEGLNEVISHESILTTLDALIDRGSLPHLLFYGPPGTGKTSTALAVARKLNGTQGMRRMVLELNASDDRGIDTVRDKIKEFASSRQLFQGGTKLIILDEADSMTRVAQFALRRVIETYTKTTRFVIIANYVNKIIPALQSRCTSFRFGPLASADVRRFLLTVADKEALPLDSAGAGLDAVITLAHGDMRKCLNVIQACKAAYGKVDPEAVYLCTGAPNPADVQKVLDSLLADSFATALAAVRTLQLDKGLSLVDLLQALHGLVLRLQLPPAALAFLLPKLADVERALTLGASEKLQLGATAGAFVIAKEIAAKEAAAAAAK